MTDTEKLNKIRQSNKASRERNTYQLNITYSRLRDDDIIQYLLSTGEPVKYIKSLIANDMEVES